MKVQKQYGLKLRSLFYLVPFEYLFEVKQIKFCYFQIDLPICVICITTLVYGPIAVHHVMVTVSDQHDMMCNKIPTQYGHM
jgi:hypothetical protein